MNNSNYQVKLEHFEGPLDLLLHLIEEEELNITQISLAKVTDQFIEYINTAEEMNPEEVADFLVVASKLLVIKSRILLPSLEIEDEGASDLEKQLRIYKEYYQASKVIESLIKKENFTFAREKPIRVLTPKFSPPKNLKLADLKDIFISLLKNLEPIVNLPKDIIRKTISISEKIQQIKSFILEKVSFSFKKLLNNGGTKVEVIVSFLAMLELIKQRSIEVKQNDLFEEIEIKKVQSLNE
ncbi:segregation/condensation protein A [Patescibacteria group bacterium]|nr:segregation/condensation protein A [Patescibacteria group bacterium]